MHNTKRTRNSCTAEDFYLGNETCWESQNPDPVLVEELNTRLGLPPLLAKVLAKRRLQNPEELKTFLRPSLQYLHDPMLLPDMKKAVNRILAAKEAGEKVIVYGDYDVDGITATSILVQFLQSLEMEAVWYIPDRADEGYGISETAVDYLSVNLFELMITVDCGISAKERIEQIQSRLALQNRKMDILITDHHQPPEKLPEVDAIVNPHLPNSEYPFPKLCGAGIALKLVQAICETLGDPDKYAEYVDLAALGTVADIVGLTDENRIIVWAGLKKIQRKPNPGIQALIKTMEMRDQKIDAWKLAFLLAPRINAAGRMGDASRAVRMFTSPNTEQVESMARELQQDNILRQKIQEEIFEKAAETIESNSFYQKQKVIVVCGEGWHHGVIGIVASMLVEQYGKPCFVLSAQEDTATGSARSVAGFNLYQGLEACRELLVKYGGHEQAGGLTIKVSDIEQFRLQINEYADTILPEKHETKKILIDAKAELGELNLSAAESIAMLAPFGEGNPTPIFRISQAEVLKKKRIGADGSHLKLLLGTQKNPVSAVAFRMGDFEPFIGLHSKLDLIFTLEINEYMGKREVQLLVKALRIPENSIEKNRILYQAAEKVECLDYDEEWIYNWINTQQVKYEDIRLSREELGVLYRYLQKAGNRIFSKADLFFLADEMSCGAIPMNYFKLLSGMFIFDELDIIRFSYTETGSYSLQVSEIIEKASLEDSMLYSFLQSVQQVVEK